MKTKTLTVVSANNELENVVAVFSLVFFLLQIDNKEIVDFSRLHPDNGQRVS